MEGCTQIFSSEWTELERSANMVSFLVDLSTMAVVVSGECKVDISSDQENNSNESQNDVMLKKVCSNITNVIIAWWEKRLDVGVEDPRRIKHAIKVGLALSAISLSYLWDPLFCRVGFGDHAIWAVMTVVVLEFSAGATMRKALNRGIGTMVAGSLAFLVCYLSEQVVQGKAFIVESSLFIIGAAATYARFFPFIRTEFDYGVLIILMTFSMITVSGYRVHNILRMAYECLTTTLIGCGLCLVVSLLFFPIWAEEDLHNSTVRELEGLSKSLQVDAITATSKMNQKILDSKHTSLCWNQTQPTFLWRHLLGGNQDMADFDIITHGSSILKLE